MTADETRADGAPVTWTFPGKYISVTTYKRDGTGVATPVWFVQEGDRLLFRTGVASGKARRIRGNPALLTTFRKISAHVNLPTPRRRPAAEPA
jgi:hypothetical protein